MSVYELGNYLYRYCFPVYRPVYFLYKNLTDRKKTAMIKNFVKPGMTALDIGANIGFYTLLLSRLVSPEGKVHAFEPEDNNFARLQGNTKHLDNVLVYKAAVGEKNEKIKLYISKRLNVDHKTFDTGKNEEYISVPCRSIDEMLGAEKVSLIKIDIQGYDYFALRGMRATIKKSPKLMIIGEFWPYGLKQAGVEPIEYIKLIEELGLKISFFESGDIAKDYKLDEKSYYDYCAVKDC